MRFEPLCTYSGRIKHFHDMFRRLIQRPHYSTIAYLRLIQLPGVYYDDRESHNDVRRSHNDVQGLINDVRASTQLFSLNLCLIWLRILKGCFVYLGNGFQLTINPNQRLNCLNILEHYVPTMYIFMINAVIFVADVVLLCSSLKTKLNLYMFGKKQ